MDPTDLNLGISGPLQGHTRPYTYNPANRSDFQNYWQLSFGRAVRHAHQMFAGSGTWKGIGKKKPGWDKWTNSLHHALIYGAAVNNAESVDGWRVAWGTGHGYSGELPIPPGWTIPHYWGIYPPGAYYAYYYADTTWAKLAVAEPEPLPVMGYLTATWRNRTTKPERRFHTKAGT